MTEFICNIWKVELGSVAFLQTPNNRTVMFDAGCSDDFSPAKHLEDNWGIERLDWLLISHPDRDHIQDLPDIYSLLYPRVLSRNKTIPENLIYPSGTENLKEPLKTYREMDKNYIHPISDDLKNPPAENWGEVLILSFYITPEHLEGCSKNHLKNNLSLVSVVKYGIFEIVFPGDLEPLGWWALLNSTKIKESVGLGEVRILIASHHGRRSGIRTEDGKVYDSFLKVMQPHLVLISDKWGNETTDPEAYRPYCLGYGVWSNTDKDFYNADVITTKTNNFVSIRYDYGNPLVVVP